MFCCIYTSITRTRAACMHRYYWGLPYVSLLSFVYSIWGTCLALYHTAQYYTRSIVLCLFIHNICTVMPTTWYEHFAVVDDLYYLYISHCFCCCNYYSGTIIVFYFRLYYHQILYTYHIISIKTSNSCFLYLNFFDICRQKSFLTQRKRET